MTRKVSADAVTWGAAGCARAGGGDGRRRPPLLPRSRLAHGGADADEQQLQRRDLRVLLQRPQLLPDRVHGGDREAPAQVAASQVEVGPGRRRSPGRGPRGDVHRPRAGAEPVQLPRGERRLPWGPRRRTQGWLSPPVACHAAASRETVGPGGSR